MHEQAIARAAAVFATVLVGVSIPENGALAARAEIVRFSKIVRGLTASNDAGFRKRRMRVLPLGLTPTELLSFEAAMLHISAAAKVAIVAEGVPLRAELTSEETSELETTLASNQNSSVKATLALIASVYDYDVEHNASGYLLRKHYSDPTDLPDVTFDEVIRSLASLLELVDVYAPTPLDPAAETSGFRFYDSLTAEQQAVAHTRAGITLALADLNPTQKQLALKTARRIVLDRQTIALRQALQHLVALHGKGVNFLWTTRTDQIVNVSRGARPGGPSLDDRPAIRTEQPIFEYVMPSASPDFIYQFPLNHGLRIFLSGGGIRPPQSVLEQVAPASRPASKFVSSQQENDTASDSITRQSTSKTNYDPTIPTLQDKRLASGMMSNNLPATVTLEALASSLSSARINSNVGVGLRVTIDPALNGKPITVFGRGLVSGDQLIRLAARVYGLLISTADNKNIYVTTPKVRPSRDVSDIQEEIRRVVPPSLLRAMETQIDRIMALSPAAPLIPDKTHSLENLQKFAATLATQKRERVAQSAPYSWYFPADRRLLVLATAAVPAPSSPPVSVASLGSEPSRLIALMSLTDGAMIAARKLLSFEPPRCFTDSSTLRIVLQCHEHGNQQGIPIKIVSTRTPDDVETEGLTLFGRQTPKNTSAP